MMRLVMTGQVNERALQEHDFDIFVAASGFEARGVHALEVVGVNKCDIKVAFGFEDRLTDVRDDNDRRFTKAGVKVIPASGDSGGFINRYITDLVTQLPRDRISILVDYSSMTRTWYAAIIKAIIGIEKKRAVEVFFTYSPAIFAAPSETTTPNAEVGPIPGFCNLEAPDKPTALVIGLGYEKERALGLSDYVDPAKCFAFYTDPPMDPPYRDSVLKNNSAFLSGIPNDHIYTHPLADLQLTGYVLLSLYSGLRQDYRVIVAPLGVKPFSLLCLLLAAHFRDLDVWRVTSGIKSSPQERKPLGPLLVLRTVFEQGE